MFIEELKKEIKTILGQAEADFSYPANPELGDLSLACFRAAKAAGQSPAEIAKRWEAEIKSHSDWSNKFSDIKAVGPYLNFFIDPGYLIGRVIGEASEQKSAYGFNQSGQGRRVMIEYSNGNTHKEYHVGHLRNIAYGDAINRLLSANGYDSIPVSYINDFGIHVAKTIWNWRRNPVYDERPEPKGYLLGNCYAKASQALENDPEGKLEVAAIMKEIESRQGENYAFWQKSRQWSIEYFDSIYKELDIKFKNIFYESEVIADGLKLVDELIKKNILVKSEGAIIANLEKYDLGVLPIIRSDGTALYPVADLALASAKFKAYDLAESIYVIDVRQSLYFKQLFKILELTGYKPAVFHLSYDFVTLPEGMMSSRTGNIITYEELKNKILDKLFQETTKRHVDWTEEKAKKTALSLALATIKFEMLKVGADKTITFNIDEALRFDGYTACYLQYSYARLKSIVRKEGFNLHFTGPDCRVLKEGIEKQLLLKIARYPETVRNAASGYNPSELTKYLFELAQLSNDYYHSINILKSAANLRRARLALVKAVAQVLDNGCAILGFGVLEEM
jgi:arginyl-tRNA synthetase